MKKTFSAVHVVIIIASLIAIILLCAFFGLFTPRDVVLYDVKFDANLKGMSGNTPDTIQVVRGRTLSQLPTPTKLDSNGEAMLFLGWYKDDAQSILDGGYEQPWQLQYDVVNEDITLYALWRDPQPYPTELNIQQKAFAGSLSWQQSGVDSSYSYNVYLNGLPVSGTYTVDGTLVTWTPALVENIIGNYTARVETKIDNIVQEDWTVRRTSTVAFKQYVGSGSIDDPYIIATESDILELNSYNGVVGTGEYFALTGNIVAPSGSSDSTFDGNFDGRGYTVTVTGNSGFFNHIGVNGIVSNFTTDGVVEDNISTAPTANTNAGIVDNITNIINVANKTTTPNDVASKDSSLLGGIVRINLEGGIIRNCTNGYAGIPNTSGNKNGAKIHSTVGGGGIVGENHGTVINCVNWGRLGSRANYETGRTVDYSYLGGIVAFNYGTVSQSINYGSMFAQRAGNSDGNGNKAFGGIAAFNQGTITECVNSADRIHADQYVGGIAGINRGTISSSYNNSLSTISETSLTYQSLMIGGRIDVGGIAGDNDNGTIDRCYYVDTVNTFNRSYSSAQADANKPNTQGSLFVVQGSGYLIANGGTITNCVYYQLTAGELTSATFVSTIVVPTGAGCVVGKPLATDMTSTLGDRFQANGRLLWERSE